MAKHDPAGQPLEQRSTLGAMRRRLEEHPALEDLGPLFGPQAQGQGIPERFSDRSRCSGISPRRADRS